LVLVPVLAQAESLMGGVKNVLWTLVNNVFGFLIGAGGVVLDFAVTKYVVGFGDTWGVGGTGTGIGGAIDLTWAMVRDIFNIGFIFGLIWLGFKMILRSDDSTTRRTLITLILAALLVNFSLYITKFVVDFTNLLATQIVGAFIIEGKVEISASFMQLFGLSSIWQGDDTVIAGDITFMYIFGTAMVFMVGAFTFFAGGIMLIIRFAALCIYMVFSPLMFLGFVFPGLRNISSSYWKGFLGRAFFAPAYLMLVYLSAYVMGSYNKDASSFSDAFAGTDEVAVANSIGPFLLVCVFLIASVVVGSKMSTTGASTAISIGNNIRGRAQRVVKNTAIGTGRFAARQTVGRAAQVTSIASERTRRSLDRSLSSMGQKGIVKRIAARTLDNTVGATLRRGENASIAGSETQAQGDKRRVEHQQKFNTTAQETTRLTATAAAHTSLEETKKILDATTSTEAEKTAAKTAAADAEKKLASHVPKMSAAEFAKLPKNLQRSEAITRHVSEATVKSMGESGLNTNAQMKGFTDKRSTGIYNGAGKSLENFSGTAEELSENLEDFNRNITRWGNETLDSMPQEKLQRKEVAANLSQRQLDHMRDSGKISDADYKKTLEARSAGFQAIAEEGSLVEIGGMPADEKKKTQTNQRAKLFSQNAQEAGKMPAAVFKNEKMTQHVTPAALARRAENLAEGDKNDIQAQIQTHINNPNTSEQVGKMWVKWADTSAGVGFTFTAKSSPIVDRYGQPFVT